MKYFVLKLQRKGYEHNYGYENINFTKIRHRFDSF